MSDLYIELLYKCYEYNRQCNSEIFDNMLRYYNYRNDETLLGYITEDRLKYLKEKFISGENGFFSTLIKICECLLFSLLSYELYKRINFSYIFSIIYYHQILFY